MFSFATQPFVLPKIFITLFTVLLLGAIVVYILFQARFLIGGPQITLTAEPETVQHMRHVTLEGTTSNITAIYLNGRPIVTNESGMFRESVVLENGYTIARIDAEDRYGRTTYIERSFVYVPQEVDALQADS